ncbi:MAG: hypothetical protein E4H02_11790 [Lentisphaerales bacterium]|jgi:hypothetical protein|nr:MAG: hypothetical protein E4H02_11790 [Lentisphaerales bacterium]
MPQFCLIQRRDIQTHIPENEPVTRIGFLDFLRELEQEELGLTRFQHVVVEGLEDVLLNARPNWEEMTAYIRQILQRHARRLEEELVANVYIVFRNPLERGETLWVNTPAEPRLPINRIFGSPPTNELDGKPYFKVSFNLSSGL